MREYKRLALRMVALSPDSMKYRMEVQYADTNLGVVLSDQRRFEEAVAQFKDALSTMEAIATADPRNADYQTGVVECWRGSPTPSNRPGISTRRSRCVSGTSHCSMRISRETGNVDFRQRLVPARRMLGYLYAERGQSDLALAQLKAAVAHADILKSVEPTNTQWLEYGAKARLDLARQLLLAKQNGEAAIQLANACDAVGSLLRKDSAKPEWRAGLATCLMLKARLAAASGDKAGAVSFAQSAVAASKMVHSGNSITDRILVAEADRVLGDMQLGSGNAVAARAAWTSALVAMPVGAAEEPWQLAEHALVLNRLGAPGRSRAADQAVIGDGLSRSGIWAVTHSGD